jgi:diguanylate cyclase (GGDEF)-like protein
VFARPHAQPRPTSLWAVIAVLVLLIGLAASWFAAGSVARIDTRLLRQEFERSSTEIASHLHLDIERQNDLVVNASGFVVANTQSTPADFSRWASSVHLLDRHPDVLGLGFVVIVPADHLAGFVADASTSARPFSVVPEGVRPFYCLSALSEIRDPSQFPRGTDWCAGSGIGLDEGDSSQSRYSLVVVGNSQLLSVNVPVYRGGAEPDSAAARRTALTGWVGIVSDPSVILSQAMLGHPEMAVTMSYQADSSAATFSHGDRPNEAETSSIVLGDGWTVQTFALPADVGVLADGNAMSLMLIGVAFSLVLAALVMALATGRYRALRLVGLRTGELRHQSLHDALTGLPNRALIVDRLEQLLARCRRNDTAGAALFVDLDDFKNVNDSLGHAAGDQLLIAVAARLTAALRDVDTIGRLGGDEFVVLIDGALDRSTPGAVAQRIIDVIRQPFQLDAVPMTINVNASVGIAIGERFTAGDLLRDADVALYQAKAAGKNRYEMFHPEMHHDILRRIELEFDLRSAIEGEQFWLAYQPVYRLGDLALVSVEALLRWNHPVRGVVMPDDFIPLLEQTGQIGEVGRWVLHRACQQMADWRALGNELSVSVNVSARQLDHDEVVDDICRALHSSGLPATSLTIEVTETALMRNPTETARRLHEINELGVRIAVDDFGTGYSSLAYLQQFPVDSLKIDRRFTNAIGSSPESKALIRTLVQLGVDLGLTTLAEGVETADQMDLLLRERVDHAQGFLLSRPLDPVALELQVLEPARIHASSPT